ncbi:Uu.00g139990.m01.CDS01 [Anthostomella pinea]|uniref:Uu.00g139990.m01.CDS01 n=1 Tax=Anthostomella pinea TaxID=933095 RepID=A0AAI8YL78_9PEZI|nr:Uu.00g139990.m01.CDS01 [Anthostomella pinea]
MGLCKELPEDIKEVDVIIAGGGTAACIVAGRLAEADPGLSILVIEGGANNYNEPSVVQPAQFLTHIAPGSTSAIFYKAVKSSYLADRECIVPSGGILGGGSSINFMMYTRAQLEDFDSWKTPGWTADEVLPYLKKLETYHGPGSPSHHGASGPIHVSDSTMRVKRVEEEWLRAARTVGYPEISDLQSLDTNNGFQRWLRYASPDGKRSDTAHAYLHPRLNDGGHPNLHVLVEAKVVRVLFEDGDGDDAGGSGKRACGVEYTPSAAFTSRLDGAPAPKLQVRARRLVVVACGACGTPLVLERSGVGNPAILQKAGVPVVTDLPGVGHDYQDHHLILYPYKTSLKPEETLDDFYLGATSFEEAAEKNDPRIGWNTCDIASKLRPTDAEVAAMGPEFQDAWDMDFRDQPNRPMMSMGLLNAFVGDASTVDPGQYVSVCSFTTYPYSRGHIHITGPKVEDELDFNVGFFSDPHDLDVKKQIWAYKKGREIIRRTWFYRGEVPVYHPPFLSSSKAGVVSVDRDLEGAYDGEATGDTEAKGQGGQEIENFEYSPEDDKVIEQFIRMNIDTTWHSLGTAKMAPREEMGVVDKDLNVYGARGLKVADLSIAPENVGANTNNTALMIGEKAADIIIKELGLGLPV